MAILTRKVTPPQRKWLKSYEATTGFEAMHQDQLDRSPETFIRVAKRNLDWFKRWADESQLHLEAELQEFENDQGSAA